MEVTLSLEGGGSVAVVWPVELRTVYLDVEITDDGEEIPRDPRVAVVVDGTEFVTRFTDEARLRAALDGKAEHHRRLEEAADTDTDTDGDS